MELWYVLDSCHLKVQSFGKVSSRDGLSVVFKDEPSYSFKLEKSLIVSRDYCLTAGQSVIAFCKNPKKGYGHNSSDYFSVSLLAQQVDLQQTEIKGVSYGLIKPVQSEPQNVCHVGLTRGGANSFDGSNIQFVYLTPKGITMKLKQTSNRAKSAHVVPYAFIKGKIWIMLPQDSIEAGKGWNKEVFDLFGGTCNKDEVPYVACKREFIEESLLNFTFIKKTFGKFQLAEQDEKECKVHCNYFTLEMLNGDKFEDICKQIANKQQEALKCNKTHYKSREKCNTAMFPLEELLNHCMPNWRQEQWDDEMTGYNFSGLPGVEPSKMISSFALYVVSYLARRDSFTRSESSTMDENATKNQEFEERKMQQESYVMDEVEGQTTIKK